MMWKEHITHAEEFQIIYVDTLLPRRWPPKVWAAYYNFSPKRGKKKCNFAVDEPDKHDVSQVVKVNITVISHADSMGPEWVVAKTVFYLCELPPPKSITPG